VIQTYQPDNYSIQAAAAQDYTEFYRQEIAYRQLMSYPPASNLFAVHASCEDGALLDMAMTYLRKYLRKIDPKEKAAVIGPADEAIPRIADRYRKVIYIKHEDYRQLVRLKDQLERYMEINSGFQKIRIQFEFNH